MTRVLQNRALNLDPALRGDWICAPVYEQAALSKTPRASSDGRMRVFQNPSVC
jgi:hypothetical protein